MRTGRPRFIPLATFVERPPEEMKARAREFYEEIKRRTRVVRIFPNAASCLRLIRALAVETHEGWLEASRYLNMDLLKEHKRLRLSLAA